MLQTIKSVFFKIILLYLAFAFVSNTLVFMIHQPDAASYQTKVDSNRFYAQSLGPDRAALIEDRLLAGITRLQLIESASERIDIAYHAVHEGYSSDLFYGSLLAAADRGVEISLLLDGLFHNLRGKNKSTLHALMLHPHAEVRFFEPLSVAQPWNWNHRLHDKFMIIDGTYAMIGGRNIGDKYFIESDHDPIVHDRDVIIYLDQPHHRDESVLKQLDAYFRKLWQHEYTWARQTKLSFRQQDRAELKSQALRQALAIAISESPQYFDLQINLQQLSVPTRKVTLIYNPLVRLNKEPWILMEMTTLFEQAKERVLLQSPYIVPTGKMEPYLAPIKPAVAIEALTNSKAASPNFFAISGYLNERQDLMEFFDGLYEYHGEGSLHAKSYIIDERLSLVGSFNLDARSAFLSTESMVVIDSEPFAMELATAKENLIAQSLVAGSETQTEHDAIEPREVSWLKSSLISILRVLLYPFGDLL